MSGGTLRCWQCGAGLDELPLPLSRRAACPACDADLHVCRMCRFHDRSAPAECTEPVADAVADKTRANFCGYLEPRPGASASGPADAAGPSAELAALFGLEAPADDERTEADRAREELDRLFDRKPDPD